MWYFICKKGTESCYRHYAPYETIDLDKLEIMNKRYNSDLDFQYACIKDSFVRQLVLNCDNRTGGKEKTYMLVTKDEAKATRVFRIAWDNLKECYDKYILAYVKEGLIHSKEYNVPIEANHDFVILRKKKLKVISIIKNNTYGCDGFKSYGFKFKKTYLCGENDPDYIDEEDGVTIKTNLVKEGYYDQDVVDMTIKDSAGNELRCYCQMEFIIMK